MSSAGSSSSRRDGSPVLRGVFSLGAIALCAGLAWWWFWHVHGELAATMEETTELAAAASDDPLTALLEESAEAEALYDEVVAPGDTPTTEQLEILVAAHAAQAEFIANSASPAEADRDRLEALEEKLADARARRGNADSDRAGAVAEELLAASDHAGAIAALEEALRLQRDVNASDAAPDLKRPARESALARRLTDLAAQPLAREVERLQTEANLAIAAGDGARAAELLRAAIERQRELNTTHPDAEVASAGRMEFLASELAAAGAVPLALERDRLIEQAQARETAGALQAAAQLYEAARDLQRRIDVEFPGSRFAVPGRADQLEAARARALEQGLGR